MLRPDDIMKYMFFIENVHILITLPLKFISDWKYTLCWQSVGSKQATLLYNPSWLGDIIWRQRTESILVQVMAWCLMAPSHYLNQYWLTIIKIRWHSSQGNFTNDAPGGDSHQCTKLASKLLNRLFHADFPGASELSNHRWVVIFLLFSDCNSRFSSFFFSGRNWKCPRWSVEKSRVLWHSM